MSFEQLGFARTVGALQHPALSGSNAPMQITQYATAAAHQVNVREFDCQVALLPRAACVSFEPIMAKGRRYCSAISASRAHASARHLARYAVGSQNSLTSLAKAHEFASLLWRQLQSKLALESAIQ